MKIETKSGSYAHHILRMKKWYHMKIARVLGTPINADAMMNVV